MGDILVLQMSWDNASDAAVVRKDGIGQDAHQPDPRPAVHQPKPFRRHQVAQGLSLFDMPFPVSDVPGQVDANVLHAIVPRLESSLFGDPVVNIIPDCPDQRRCTYHLRVPSAPLSRGAPQSRVYATSLSNCSARFDTCGPTAVPPDLHRPQLLMAWN